MSQVGSPPRCRVAVGIIGGPSRAEVPPIPGYPSPSVELEVIRPDESLAQGIERIRPDSLVLVYKGFDEQIRIPVDICVPVDLVYDAGSLTGYGFENGAQRTWAEKGVALLRALAPSVQRAIAPSEDAALFLSGACGFSNVFVAPVAAVANCSDAKVTDLVVRIEGPFDSTYSLAVVNAGLALGLAGLSTVECGLSVAPGDQLAPDELAMRKNPRIARLWTGARHAGQVDAVVRNCYPPSPEGMDARGRYLYFFWEDSRISPQWAERFNQHLTGVLAPTAHVEKVLRDSGVTIPIAIVGCGLDEQALVGCCVPTPIPTQAGFRFLHISSGFPRKGVDVLLDAYFAEFSRSDDVCLVIKTFPNIHNTTEQYLAGLRAAHPAGPEVLTIERDLRDYAYYGLYPACDCFVSATRCEGFGLPMAESMAFGLPTIVTDYSGQTDFCDDRTAFMVGSSLVETGSHLKVDGSMWAEPSRESLAAHMRYVFENRDAADVVARVEAARRRARSLTWHNAATAAADFIRSTVDAS